MMKKLTFLFFLFTLLQLQAQTKINQKDSEGNLTGFVTKEALLDEAYKEWYELNHTYYKPNKIVVDQIETELEDVSIVCIMGTWCEDSQREVPAFLKIMEQANFDFKNKLKIIAVDRSKEIPKHIPEEYKIIQIPTIIFYRDNKELGRFVEIPRESLEEDFLKILTNQPYKHSYE